MTHVAAEDPVVTEVLSELSPAGTAEAVLARLERQARRLGTSRLPGYRVRSLLGNLRGGLAGLLLLAGVGVVRVAGEALDVELLDQVALEELEQGRAEQLRQRQERREARAAARAAAADDSPAALEARAAAERERKARNKAAQRARERGAQTPASRPAPSSTSTTATSTPTTPPPAAPPAPPAPPVTATVSPPPVTASQPVTSPVTSPPPAGDTPPAVTAPVTASHAGEGAAASDSPLPPPNFEKERGEGESPREVTVAVTTPPVAPPAPQAGSLEAQIAEVVCFWAASFGVEPKASTVDEAAVAVRLREPHTTVAHVLAAVSRAATKPNSWFRQGDRYLLRTILGQKFAELRDEGLGLAGPTSGRSPSPPPASSPPALASAAARPPPPGPGERYPTTLPRDFFGHLTSEERENQQIYGDFAYQYDHNKGLYERVYRLRHAAKKSTG